MKIIIYRCDYCPRSGENLKITEHNNKDYCDKCLEIIKNLESKKSQDKNVGN